MQPVNSCGWTAALLLIAAAAIPADSPTVSATINGVEIGKPAQPPADAKDRPSRERCLAHCSAAETRCGGEVRRAKRDCSRIASTGGRDPMTMRNNDYAYFCGYFNEPGLPCGSDFYSHGCAARFHQRYAHCLDAMQENVMAARQDCYLAERRAQNYCRDELRDCKAACE